MRVVVTFVVFLTGLFYAGCAAPPPLLPPASSTPARMSAAVAQGRSHELATGNYRAYWVWRDDDDVWHLRTTARRTGHRYQGTIRPLTGGEIVGLELVGIDPKDRVGMVGRALSFDWRTRRVIDGFDFRLSGDVCLEFDLRLDEDGTTRTSISARTRLVPRALISCYVPKARAGGRERILRAAGDA